MGDRAADGPYIGLLIPDERIKTANLRANDAVLGNSDYTQAGPRAGVPEFDQDEVAVTSSTAGDLSPSLSLEALGDQSATKSYHVKVLKGGMPGSDATVVRRDALTGTAWRGWNTANVPGHLHVDSLLNRDASTGVNYTSVSTADDMALFLYWNQNQLLARKYDPEAHTAAAAVVVVERVATIDADAGTYENPTAADSLVDAIVLPSGRVIAYYIALEIDANTSSTQLWASYSDDDGATWRTAQYLGWDGVLDLSSINVYKLRAAYSAGAVLMFIEKDWVSLGTKRGFLQYASDDTGLNFVLVKDDQADGVVAGPRHMDVLVDRVSGVFMLVYQDQAASRILIFRLSSPYMGYLDGELVTVLSSILCDHLVAYTSQDGSHYVTFDQTDGIDIYKSRDGGSTWAHLEQVWNWNSTEEVFAWEVTEAAGRACWLLGQTASSGTLPLTDHKFIIAETGGWNTLCQPRILEQDPTTNRGFGSTTSPEAGTWIATEAPEYFGWTKTGGAVIPSGTAPIGLNPTGTTHYSVVPAGTAADGLICYFGMFLSSAGSVAALNVGVNVILGTFEIEVRFSATQIRIWDVHAGSAVGTVTPGGLGSQTIFKLALRKSNTGAADCSVTLYSRQPATDAWTQLITATTLTAGASPGDLIDWGNFAVQDSEWTFFHWVADAGSGEQGRYFDDLSQDTLAQRPMVLYGAPLPVPPHLLYLDQGLTIRGTSGPATRGDTWKIAPRFDYPVDALDPVISATPTRRWRSTDTTDHTFSWDLTLASTLGNSSIGLYLGGINFPVATFLGWNGAAWVTLATLQADQGLSGVACIVTGDTVTVDTGASVDARYVQFGEFVGGYARFNGGDVRRIVWNSEGSYTDSTTKRPEFRFEGTAPAGATATVELWHPSALVLLHENVTTYSRYALRIPATTTADGYFEIGVVLMGAVALLGHKYARGRVIETAPNYSLRQDQAGARAGKALGPARRAVTFGWSEVDLTAISGDTPDPDFVSMRSVSAPPVADRYGAPLLIEGLIRDLGGAARPVVYVPRIPETTGGDKQTKISSREGCVYARLMSTVSRQARLGTENTSEVVTLNGVRLEEEV